MYKTPKSVRIKDNGGSFDEVVMIKRHLNDGDLIVERKSPNRVEFASLGQVPGWRPGDAFDGYLKGSWRDGRWGAVYGIVITML